ncbi:hypothetical protein V5D56_14480 [Cellulosimicrobium sp. PMB13]|uniref:NACHT domain-containing protein n=1 Tax=Cellulosimicrobium sp. PMB13 TaxID=3120158 RepID=UPI003F4B05C0
MGNDRARQQDAIRAFVASQFDADKTVKFKQVSLSNDLLDLFIDVPVGFPNKFFERSGNGAGQREKLASLLATVGGIERPYYVDEASGGQEIIVRAESGRIKRLRVGAAELLLSEAAQEHLRLIVLEGAPGQGKSTLAQYVCQMHRARYLKKADVFGRIDDKYKQTAFRVPFKVDLRDYAAFLDGNSPFADSNSAQPRTFDLFLAQLITYSSGGVDFSAYDVLSLLKSMPALLFLDGLDEVADIAARESLVASIGEALTRWNEFEIDLQVVVTSRPSVFGRAPSFGKFGFTTLTLENIDRARVNDYADRWVRARALNDSEQRDVKKILSEKLELAHIRDLTRNPMQLTILLSLIHQIGHSLPDQRTDLYSRYVDLFLTREADKSVRVRENRPVLLGFIQHLAWVLQTQAESSKSAGSISVADLQTLARSYLESGGHDVDIADDLFGGGLERIFVLVERIEGLYEFEVQPLREYYCAQYLYTTAPVGTYRDLEIHGDRAQRFEALASNPFWLNVCRFYAGSCERGETGTLVLSLEEMIKTGDVVLSVHARRVGLALLQDWVFSNSKYPQNRLVQAVFDDDGVQVLLVGDGLASEEVVLDADCGRNALRDLIFDQLKSWPVDIRTSVMCQVLRMNGGENLAQRFCELLEGTTGTERSYQLVRMFRSGAASGLEPQIVWRLILEDDPHRKDLVFRCSELVWAESELASRMPELIDVFVTAVLGGQVTGTGHSYSSLSVLAELLGNSPGTYLGLRRVLGLGVIEEEASVADGGALIPPSVQRFLLGVSAMELDSAFERPTPPEAWRAITELARDCFGETWSAMSIAIRVAGMRVVTGLPQGSDRLFDPTVPLCARARAARLRRGGTAWWLRQLDEAKTVFDRMFWAGLVLMWSSAKNLYELADQTNEIVESLADDDYRVLRATILSAASGREYRTDRKKLPFVDLRPFSDRSAVLVATAFGSPSADLRYSSKQEKAELLGPFIDSLREAEELAKVPSWKDAERALAWARRVYEWRRSGRRGLSYATHRHMLEARLRPEAAAEILEAPKLYPPELVIRGLQTLQSRYRPRALVSAAFEEGWTFD